jgi:hypothetical protein
MPSIQTHTPQFNTRFAVLVVAAVAASLIAATAVRTALSLPSATAAAVRPLSLTQRVLPASTLPGFVSPAPLSVVHSAQRWATSAEQSATPAREAARLHRLGFVSGIDETLHGRSPLAAEAISLVERYRSAAGARAELAHQRQLILRNADGQKLTVVRSTGIPGAFAWSVKSRQMTGNNVAFTSGAYYYVVGSGAAPHTSGAPTMHQILTAAQVLNLVANGCVARPSAGR